MDFKIVTNEQNAGQVAAWLATGQGVAAWASLNLSNPGANWLTPALTTDGQPMGKPTWQAANEPDVITFDSDDIGVENLVEVKRFHVALRRSSNGLSMKLTDASSRKLHKAVDDAGDGATYNFDHFTQEAVILAPTGDPISLTTWKVRGAE